MSSRMNTYATYDFYETSFGGTLVPFDVFDKFNRNATAFIDYITFNRVKGLEDISDEVKLATCNVIEYMYQLTGGTGIDPLQQKASEEVGNYKVSYQHSANKEVETLYYQAAKVYLAPTGMLYRGVK